MSILLCLLLLCSLLPPVSAAKEPAKERLHEDVRHRLAEGGAVDVLVKRDRPGALGAFVEGITGRGIESIAARANGTLRRETAHFAAITLPAEKVAALADDPGVGGIYLDAEYGALLDKSVPAVKADVAHAAGYDGEGVTMAILDTGIDEGNGVFEGRVVSSAAFTGEDHTVDRQGHGTHIAAIAAGNSGVAPGASILNAKVLSDTGKGSSSSIIAGIEWATQEGADVISLSLGSRTAQDVPLNQAIQEAIDAGVVVVAAAGNCGPCGNCGGFTGVTSPGGYGPVITVGAVDDGYARACFSSGAESQDGIKPDVVAPGVDITAAGLNGVLATVSGTSVATPHVSGAVALLLQKGRLSPSQVKSLLESTASDVDAEGKDPRTGSGVIDVAALLGVDGGQGQNASSMVIERAIGTAVFREKRAVNESRYSYAGEMAEYQEGERFVTRVGVIKFPTVTESTRFQEESISYTGASTIDGKTVYVNDNGDYWFWSSGNRFVWVFFQGGIGTATGDIVSAYLDRYPPTQAVAATHTGVQEVSVQYGPEAVEATGGGGYAPENTGCTDNCDSRSYKTDLTTGTCHNRANYVAKGTTYNRERGWTHTDSCNDGSTLREYFMLCDYYSSAWCPAVGFICMMDETFYYDKACSSIGSGYVCSNGACVQQCDYSPACAYSVKRECVSTAEYKKYGAATACQGDCSLAYDNNYLCAAGQYCSGTAYDALPCRSCSASCDGQCISKTCYGTDPDCTGSGGVVTCCSDAQCGSGKVCSGNACVDPYTQISMVDYYLSSSTLDVARGGTFTMYYRVQNSAGVDLRVGLGASVVDSVGNWHNDPANDVVYTVPAQSTVTKTRTFTASVSDPFGTYAVVWGLHRVDANDNFNGELGMWRKDGILRIIGCGDAVCNNGETPSSCAADCPVVRKMAVKSIDAVTPAEGTEAQAVSITATVKNEGTVKDSIYLEGAVVPESWAGIVYPSEYRIQGVYDNPVPVCPANTYYNSKIIELDPGQSQSVTFAVTAPTKTSVDACDTNTPKRSAWDASFRAMVGAYRQAHGGYESFFSQPYSLGTCEFPYGTSAACSCPAITCKAGYDCDRSGTYGVCKQHTCSYPDGSSETCECDSDRDCPSGKICNEGPGWDACIVATEPDECTTIDAYQCKDGSVYRCKQEGIRKVLALADACGYNEICPSDVATAHQCRLVGGYDLTLEQASSGTPVNKQVGDTLTLRVKATAAVNAALEYNTGAFTLKNGPCSSSSFGAGTTTCAFSVNSLGKHEFKLLDDSETVKVIEDPYALYVTNTKQLYRRYASPQSVDILLAKAYESAAKYKGVVYDLNGAIAVPHPFDKPFTSYNEPVKAATRNNAYVIAVSDFIHQRCNGCRETILVGDDYVVPSAVKQFQKPLPPLIQGLEPEQKYYSDIDYSTRAGLQFADFAEAFSNRGAWQAKKVMFIVPVTTDPALDIAIANLKSVLQTEFNPRIQVETADRMSSLNGIQNAEKDSMLVIIGNPANNRAFQYYPFAITPTANESMASIERNPWNNKEYALVIDTPDATGVDWTSAFISSGAYKQLRSPTAYYFKVANEGLLVISMVGGAVAIAAASEGTALPFEVYAAIGILDGVAGGVNAIDSCVVNYEGKMSCVMAAGFAVLSWAPIAVIRKMLRNVMDFEITESITQKLGPLMEVVQKSFYRLRSYWGDAIWHIFVANEDDAKYLAAGVKKIVGESVGGAEVQQAIKIEKFELSTAETSIPKAKMLLNGMQQEQIEQASLLKTAGKVESEKGAITMENNIQTEVVKNFEDRLLDAKAGASGAKGARFEIEVLAEGDMSQVNAFNKKIKFTYNGKEVETDIDKGLLDGTIIEAKYKNDWSNIANDLFGDSNKLDKLATYQDVVLRKPNAPLITKMKVPVPLNPQEGLKAIPTVQNGVKTGFGNFIDQASAFKSTLKQTHPQKEVKFVVVDAIGQNFEVMIP